MRSAEAGAKQQQYIAPFLNTLSAFISHPTANKRDIAVLCLEAVLPRPEYRNAVWNSPNIISGYGIPNSQIPRSLIDARMPLG